MNGLKPINLDNGLIQIHPLRSSDIIRTDEIESDLFEIFGDIDSIPYNKEKYVENKETLSIHMLGVSIGYQQQIRYTHFLTLKESNKIIGEIIILSPKSVKEAYGLEGMWIIEFYLNKQFWNNGIMSDAIQAIILNMKQQGIANIGALVDRKNIPSVRVLEKVGFVNYQNFDLKQDLYKI